MALAREQLVVVQPLPLVLAGSVVVADGVSLLEDEEGSGTVFLWGQATWTWDGSDPGARRLAVVQLELELELVGSGAASQRQVAVAFGVHETTVWRWSRDYKASGLVVLLPQRKGPRHPSKLTDEMRAEIARLRSSGLTKPEVAVRTGVSTQSVRRATLGTSSPRGPEVGSAGSAGPSSDLVPLNPPIERTAEREAARQGMLGEAAPVICEGRSLPFVGSLIILPALVATGLLEAAASVYDLGLVVAGVTRAAYYGLRSLVLCVVFSSLLGEPRAEGLTRLDPASRASGAVPAPGRHAELPLRTATQSCLYELFSLDSYAPKTLKRTTS